MSCLARVFSWFLPNAAVRTNEKSSKDILAATFACTDTFGERPKGLYLDGDRVVEMGAEAKDRNKTHILWSDTLRYTGLISCDTNLVAWN